MLTRLFDVVLATFGLLLTWPLILIGAVAVKLTSWGPAFYRARRAGLRGIPFDMFKLRTMRAGCEVAGRRITEVCDERVTAVGKPLRKFRIDELPQLWNVLRGDMSIVGPRPEEWEIIQQHYGEYEWRALEVRPGIVSPADVRWYPDFTYHAPPPPGVPLQEYYLAHHLPAKMAEEIHYVENHTLATNLKIIGQTILCLLIYSWWPPKREPLTINPL